MRPWPIAGGAENPQEELERQIAEGRITREAIAAAEQLWQERLQRGVTLPNGETVILALTDLFHMLRDHRIWRHPGRIELLLENVFEIRSAQPPRRRAFSRWQEAERSLVGYAILTPDSRMVTLHVIRDSEFRRLRRQGDRLWP